MITLQNETYYGIQNFSLVALGELTGDYKVVSNDFIYIVVEDKDGQYIINK
tara:strand:+ start:321 stop:473 length:153 start_codon:yes stop_codon:yes gene_type:complete